LGTARLHAGRQMARINITKTASALSSCWMLAFLFPCLFAVVLMPQHKPEVAIASIGCFLNLQRGGEHDSGYSVRLWFQGDQIIGLLDYHRGLAGDPPMGILTDIRYDALTGKISFKAKLTSGLHSCRIHKNVPSHDMLSFKGFLKPDGLAGNIHLEDRLDSPPAVVDDRENFVMLRAVDCLTKDYANYNAWWKEWQAVYNARGAKW
jgi:hypothetical protein